MILRAEGADGASDAIENCLLLQEVCLAVEVALSLSLSSLLARVELPFRVRAGLCIEHVQETSAGSPQWEATNVSCVFRRVA